MKGPHGKDIAFAGVMTKTRWGIGAAEEDEPGYTPMPNLGEYDSFDEANAAAMVHNVDRLGLSKDRAYEIIISSQRMGSQR